MLVAQDMDSSTILLSNEYEPPEVALLTDETEAENWGQGKKYLLRLINTSVATTFVFSIDNHNLTVMSSDFVPIEPYVTDHVTIGIGELRLPTGSA